MKGGISIVLYWVCVTRCDLAGSPHCSTHRGKGHKAATSNQAQKKTSHPTDKVILLLENFPFICASSVMWTYQEPMCFASQNIGKYPKSALLKYGNMLCVCFLTGTMA